jgi:hypothetical protein
VYDRISRQRTKRRETVLGLIPAVFGLKLPVSVLKQKKTVATAVKIWKMTADGKCEYG